MPLFEFECQHCGDRIERIFANIERVDEWSKVCRVEDCPGYYKRVQSASNFILKGSGFHANDYPKK